MRQYLNLLETVFTHGREKKDRTGTGTRSQFGPQMRFDLTEGFPLVTTKKVHLRSIIHELLWFLKGDTNIQYLKDSGVSIWDEWAREETRSVPCVYTVEERASILRKRSSVDGKTTDWYNEWEAGLLEGDDDEAKMVVLDSQNVPREGCREETIQGELGPVYGKQWRDWTDIKTAQLWDEEGQAALLAKGYVRLGNDDAPASQCQVYYRRSTDQISKVIDQLRNDPDNRRIIVSAWNVGELDEMALAPCHAFFQFYTRELTVNERMAWAMEHTDLPTLGDMANAGVDYLERNNVPTRGLSCQLYQRSADIFLGVPFNIASYALLTEMVAQQVNMVAEEFIWTGGDVHLYSNHVEQAELQLSRDPLPLPKLKIVRKPDSIFDYQFEDFVVEGYESHPAIKAPVAI